MGRGPTKEYYKTINDSYVEGTLTCVKPQVIKERITTEFPLVLNVEPTNDCNSDCYYCPRKKMVKVKGVNYMALETFRNIVDQIGSRKLLMLNLHKDGEPLLHKDLPAMVEYAKEKDAAQIIHLNTNGILINTKTGRGIIEKGIDDITISVDAAFESTYKKFKRRKGLKKLEENIRNIIDYRDRINSRTKIRVKIIEFDDIGKDEIEYFLSKWQTIADEVQVTGVHNWSGAIENLNITDEKTTERYPCSLLWYMLAVNSNGEVSVCNVDWNYSGVVGDLFKDSIKDIWNGIKIKKIRDNHLNEIWDSPQVCNDCVVWVSCGDNGEFFKTRTEFV